MFFFFLNLSIPFILHSIRQTLLQASRYRLNFFLPPSTVVAKTRTFFVRYHVYFLCTCYHKRKGKKKYTRYRNLPKQQKKKSAQKKKKKEKKKRKRARLGRQLPIKPADSIFLELPGPYMLRSQKGMVKSFQEKEKNGTFFCAFLWLHLGRF